MRFLEAIEKFKQYKALEKEKATIRGYDLDLRQFCLWLRNNPLITQITIEHVIEYVNGMKSLGWAQNSVMIKCVALTQFFKFWAKKGYPVLNYELIPHVKREYVQPRVAEDENIKKVLEYCDTHPEPYFIRMKAMIMLAMDTGCRNGEICSFNLDIDTETCEKFNDENQYAYIIKSEKSRGKNPFRKVFWYDQTNEALKKWLSVRNAQKDEKALFVGIGGQGARQEGKRVTVKAITKAMSKLSRIAGIPLLNMHSLRHRFGNNAAAEGANNSTISDLMGHASLTSSFVYTHLNDKQAKSAHIKYKKKLA